MENEKGLDSKDDSLECLNEIDDIWNQFPWMPSKLAPDFYSNQESLIRKCRSIFNKVTTVDETLPKLVDEFDQLTNEVSEQQMKEIVAMYFDKVTDEPAFLTAYIEFVIVLSKRRQLFKKVFIVECQKQFEGNVLNFDRNVQLQRLSQNVNESYKQRITFDKEKQKLTRKSIKIVRFIGELFNNNILTPSIMLSCAKQLLDQCSEPSLECLCTLLITIGLRLDDPLKLTEYFNKMQRITENKNENVEIGSRLRSVMLNVLDMRNNNWVHQRRTTESVDPLGSDLHQQQRRTSHNATIKNGKKGSRRRIRRNNSSKSGPDQKSNRPVSNDLTSNRIRYLLRNEIDLDTIREYISTNLAGVDAENIRATLRTVVECLMEEETLNLRGNEEAASILQMFFELLEKKSQV